MAKTKKTTTNAVSISAKVVIVLAVLAALLFFFGRATAMTSYVSDGCEGNCGGGDWNPTPTPTIAPSPTTTPYWLRGGTASAANFGPRFLAKGSCAYSASNRIAELGNDALPSFQIYVSNFLDYLLACKTYQNGLKRGINDHAQTGVSLSWEPVPNGKRI